tara:strand:+ start:196 stop:891 length:696 start_codon:yes stop_codon:yes gene_type:complete
MKEIDFAYFPLVGRGEQINIICSMHGIKVNNLSDFNKDEQAPFGTVPWIKDHSNNLELNDSLAIIQYLVNKYDGPLTPENPEESGRIAMYWGWVQDYYSYVLSPFHDIITGHNETFWRNLRLTDTLVDGGKEKGIENLAKLHKKRVGYLEKHLENTNSSPFLNGPKCSYADIFLFTSVKTVQETEGFGILRDACNGKPFEGCQKILDICDEVGKIDKVNETIGTKFKESPF